MDNVIQNYLPYRWHLLAISLIILAVTLLEVPDRPTKIKRVLLTSSTPPHHESFSSSSSTGLVHVKKPSRGFAMNQGRDEGLFSCVSPQWTQVGMGINGTNARDSSGHAIALSADGQVMAVSAPNNDGVHGSNSGQVRVFKTDDESSLGWSQVGLTLEGSASSDNFGISISLSDDGNVLAVGSSGNDLGGSNSGNVRIFQMNQTADLGWTQIGQDIVGESSGDGSGHSLALSGSGDIVVIGARFNDNENDNEESGHVRIYQKDTSSSIWVQLGQDLDGEASGDRSGEPVVISDSGDIVAIGTIGSSSGYVRVYHRDSSFTLGWVQQGGDIPSGDASRERSGLSISLSHDGSVLAIGAYEYDSIGDDRGQVSIYHRDPSSSLGWTMLGQALDGEVPGDRYGYSVALSGNGETIVIGAPNNNDLSGRVTIYQRDLSSSLGWVQVGNDVDGEDVGDQFGYSVALSRNGEVLAIGAPWNDANGRNSGNVRVFQACNQDASTAPTPTPTCPPDADKKAKFFTGKFKVKPNGKKKPKTKTCQWLSNAGIWKINKFCAMTDGHWWTKPAREVCTGTCNSCGEI